MAKKKKRRRPSAGPPPAPKKKTVEEEDEAPRRRAPREPVGPREPSFQGVLIRATLVAVLFYPYLIFIAGESSRTAFLISGIAFVAMIPLGLLLDHWRYRIQKRRFQREQGGK